MGVFYKKGGGWEKEINGRSGIGRCVQVLSARRGWTINQLLIVGWIGRRQTNVGEASEQERQEQVGEAMEAFYERLQEEGLKSTKQRDLIVERF